MSDYTMTITLASTPADAEAQVREALAEEGFGILSEIDVQAALLEKIAADDDIGALLPCNVLLRANSDGGTDVVAADPWAMLALAGPGLEALGTEARDRIQRALDSLAS